jgi:thiamine-monophosphate kinase
LAERFPSPFRGGSRELAFIAALRALATHPAARGLLDDAAILPFGGNNLILTHDMIVEGVHFLPHDPPEDVAWKLVAVNLSDLAAKGAVPIGMLAGYTLSGAADRDAAFVRGLGEAIRVLDIPLLGGDTVSVPAGTPRSFGLTAIGRSEGPVPSRSGARDGDTLWVSGTIGDADAGLRAARGEMDSPALLDRYRRPQPRLSAGQALATLVSAMMDVSDGLLIDARRMAEASGLGVEIDLDAMPLSAEYRAACGDDLPALLAAATGGDDYELLFTATDVEAIAAVSARVGLPLTSIGRMRAGSGLRLAHRGAPVRYDGPLGWEHHAG